MPTEAGDRILHSISSSHDQHLFFCRHSTAAKSGFETPQVAKTRQRLRFLGNTHTLGTLLRGMLHQVMLCMGRLRQRGMPTGPGH